MPDFRQSLFPTIEDVATLTRSIVNDTFPGLNGAQGRVFTDDAPFTIPFLNSAIRKLMRELRNEGVTFPTKDNVILSNLTPVAVPSTSIQVYVGYNGYFDGTSMHASPALPSDMMQPYDVSEQTVGTNLEFCPMSQPQGGIDSTLQGPYLGVWEWRDYKIFMPGSIQAKNLRLRYKAAQVPLDVQPKDFASTAINIVDCQEALAYEMAAMYAEARGAASVESLRTQRAAAIFEMANEFVRRSQSVRYRRQPYPGGGPNNANGVLGGTGWVG